MLAAQICGAMPKLQFSKHWHTKAEPGLPPQSHARSCHRKVTEENGNNNQMPHIHTAQSELSLYSD